MDAFVCLDEIVSIEHIGVRETIDITVSGDNLFFANNILTHNSGGSNSDPNVEDISESHGTSMTADFIAAIITTDELESLGQLMIKQIKSRYSDKSQNKRFVVGIDRGKSRLYDIEQSGQEGIIDKGNSEDQMEELYAKTFSKKKSAFEGFTV